MIEREKQKANMRYLMKLNKLSPKSTQKIKMAQQNNSDAIPSKYQLTKVMEEKAVKEYLNEETNSKGSKDGKMPMIKNSNQKLEPLQQSQNKYRSNQTGQFGPNEDTFEQ